MKTLRAILVDDERYARKEMVTLLEKHPEIEVIGEASSIRETVEIINSLKPDLVFLDVQLKGETGFELFEKVKSEFTTVFVTAFDTYAIRAFEINAFDYLLKPVNPKRLAVTVDRLLTGEKINHEPSETGLKYDDCIFVPLKEGGKFIRLSSILAITAENEYSKITTAGGKNILIYRSLKKWEELLPENHFVRIHRSAIVNINSIREVKKMPNNTGQIFINDISEPFEMSRRYTSRIKERFNGLV